MIRWWIWANESRARAGALDEVLNSTQMKPLINREHGRYAICFEGNQE